MGTIQDRKDAFMRPNGYEEMIERLNELGEAGQYIIVRAHWQKLITCRSRKFREESLLSLRLGWQNALCRAESQSQLEALAFTAELLIRQLNERMERRLQKLELLIDFPDRIARIRGRAVFELARLYEQGVASEEIAQRQRLLDEINRRCDVLLENATELRGLRTEVQAKLLQDIVSVYCKEVIQLFPFDCEAQEVRLP
jgi:hypothetical protein